MTTDDPVIRTREQGEAYREGWRDRRDGWDLRPPPKMDDRWYLRGWNEADWAIRLGRNIGQLTPPR